MRKIPVILLLSLSCFTLGAQSVDKVNTKDGAVYEGYISEQIPGSEILIFAEKATRTIPTPEIKNLRTDPFPYESLTRAGQKWIQENGDTDNIVLYSFEYKGEFYDQVIIVRKDERQTQFVSFTPRTYRLKWTDVAKTSKLLLPKEPYGLRDVITLSTGDQYSGQILEQDLLEKSVKIRPEDGEPVTIASADIISLRVEAIDPQAPLLEQAYMLDRLTLDDGDVVEGVIVSRVLRKKVIIRHLDNVEESIPINRIVKYQKYWNKNYVPYVAPVVDTKPSMLMNGEAFELTQTFRSGEGWYALETYKYKVPVGGTVKIRVKNVEVDATASMYKASVTKYTYKKDQEHYGQSYPTVLRKTFPLYEAAFIPAGENARVCELQVRQPGIYFITIKGEDTVLLIETE